MRSFGLNVATRSSDERPDIVMLPSEELLKINCSPLKDKQVTGAECILQSTRTIISKSLQYRYLPDAS